MSAIEKTIKRESYGVEFRAASQNLASIASYSMIAHNSIVTIAVFQNSLSALKIYSLRYIYYTFSTLAVNLEHSQHIS